MNRFAQHLKQHALVPAFLMGLLALWLGSPSSWSAVRQSDSIFAMADIHGNYESAVALLQEAGLINSELRWIGGGNTLVQTGDYTDRGPEVRRVLDMLMALEDDAGPDRAIILLGNHEMMNILGDLADVTNADYASFVDQRSESRREDAFDDYVEYLEDRADRFGRQPREVTEAFEREWFESHPSGFVEHRQAFSSDGDYGKWLRQRRTVAELDQTIFLHAGISPIIAGLSLSVDQINTRVQDEIRVFDRYKAYLVDQDIALPFFTFAELVNAVRTELDVLQGEVSAEQSEAVRRGRDFEPSAQTQQTLQILEGFLGMGSWLTIHSDGILWFRGYARWTDAQGPSLIQAILDQFDVERFVVGHTPQLDQGMTMRFDDQVVLLDTGMLSSFYPGGRPAMLEIAGDDLRPIYLD
jgi:hypothetical protein